MKLHFNEITTNKCKDDWHIAEERQYGKDNQWIVQMDRYICFLYIMLGNLKCTSKPRFNRVCLVYQWENMRRKNQELHIYLFLHKCWPFQWTFLAILLML